MAKDDKKEEAAAKPEPTPEEAAAKAKKKKLLFIVIGGVVLTGGIGAGLALFLGGGGDKGGDKPKDEHAKEEHAAEGKDAKKDEHDKDAKKDEHGKDAKKEEAKDVKKEEAKDAKKDEHGKDGKDAKDGNDAKGKDSKDAKIEGVDFGCTHSFQPFHLNLGNPLENRYIRLEVAVEYGCAPEIKAELDKRLPQLRDAVIAVTSRKTREFLLGPDGKEQLRKEIHNRLNHYMTRKIDDVFITDILIE